jgi:hypothetical protein
MQPASQRESDTAQPPRNIEFAASSQPDKAGPSIGTTCAFLIVMPPSHLPVTTDPDFVLSSLWTASRGEQIVNCELMVPGRGLATLRCGYGPHSVIRSQCIASPDAATEVADSWKALFVEQGFHIVSRSRQD